MATRLWNFLTTDLASAAPVDASKEMVADYRTADAADVVLNLATVLADDSPNTQMVAALVGQIDSLLDALNAPLGKLVGAPQPLGNLGPGLLKFYLKNTPKEPTLAQSVALISQAAYLSSFQEFVKRHPKVDLWLAAKDATPQAKTITLAVKALGLFELTDAVARAALLSFDQSALAQAFNAALNARLLQLGATPEIASRMVETVAKNTNRHLKTAIAKAGESFQHQLDGDRA